MVPQTLKIFAPRRRRRGAKIWGYDVIGFSRIMENAAVPPPLLSRIRSRRGGTVGVIPPDTFRGVFLGVKKWILNRSLGVNRSQNKWLLDV